MDWTSIVVAVIAALGGLLGAYFSNRKSAALLAYRMEQLERKVERHNNMIERTYQLEKDVARLTDEEHRQNARLEGLERKVG